MGDIVAHRPSEIPVALRLHKLVVLATRSLPYSVSPNFSSMFVVVLAALRLLAAPRSRPPPSSVHLPGPDLFCTATKLSHVYVYLYAESQRRGPSARPVFESVYHTPRPF